MVFGTRGNSGGNNVGYEQGASLAAVREMEARHALALLNITNIWFLDAPDTPAPTGHNVLRSLETWNHGRTLGEVVRFIRLTRPAVVLTFLPAVVVGENHEDHQAAGVIATEAFDIAGDPTQFPEQVSFSEDHKNFGMLLEGLRPWQPQKLYYFSDADDQAFLKGKGPEYSVTEISPSRNIAYFRFWLSMARIYQTQYENIPPAEVPEPASFNPPPRGFALGKSHVGGSVTGDIMEATSASPVPFAGVRGYQPSSPAAVYLELAGPWSYYRDFWKAHNLDHLAALLPVPQIGTWSGATLYVPLALHNNSAENKTFSLHLDLPQGWKAQKGSANYPTSSKDLYPATAVLVAPTLKESAWQEIRFTLESAGKPLNTVTLRVHINGTN